MSISQTTSQSQPFDIQHCRRCGMVLPPTATFCGKCGDRVEKFAQHSKEVFSTDKPMNLERYRITSLIQRIPYTQLSLAMDIQQQRPVAIRDIDIQQIDLASRSHILKALQQEYDLLRQKHIYNVLPLIASFYAQNHLYSISAWPLTTLPHKREHGQAPHIYTLQDLLQSGIGLPDEQTALHWILHLTNAIEYLHSNNIVIGTLDPSTILVSQKDYSGQPTLFPSWMLPAVQSQIQQALNIANAAHISHITSDRTAFFSPETRQGRPEMRSDVYSMGAILYFLVTGIAPAEQSSTTSQQVRSPREINPRVQNTLATTILKALARDPAARFQSVNEFAAVLLQQQGENQALQRLYHVPPDHKRSAETTGIQSAEVAFTSAKDNTKTEQGKAPQADWETSDETISVGPMPNQLARHYLSRMKTQKLGPKQLNSDHEVLIVENRPSEPIMQLTREETEHIQSKNSAIAPEIVSEAENETSLQVKSDNPATSIQDEQNMDNRQLSSMTDIADTPTTLTTDADIEQNSTDNTEIASENISPTIIEASTNLTTDADQTLHNSIDNSLENDEQTLLTEQSQQNASTGEAATNSENTSSSSINAAALSPSLLPAKVLPQDKRGLATLSKLFSLLLERVKRTVLGSQSRINNAVALIETPMRIQPNKNYSIRIHIMGRNEPKHAARLKQSNSASGPSGLGSLAQGELVHIEVRSVLYHNYAYIVQQTDVEVPAHNYAAEVTIPMQSIRDSSGIQRERLHIFFTDKEHNPLYEKPFLIELFISNLVQPGHEGHNVLAIPL